MKLLIAMAAVGATAIGTAAQAETWWRVEDVRGATVFVDASSVKRPDRRTPYHTATELVLAREYDWMAYPHAIEIRREYDCTNRRVRTASIVYYQAGMVEVGRGEGDAQFVVPRDPLTGRAMEFVCGDRSRATHERRETRHSLADTFFRRVGPRGPAPAPAP